MTYYPLEGASFTVRGVFNTVFQQVDPDTGAIVGSNQPNLGVRLTDFDKAPASGDKMEIRGKSYVVVDTQEDGEGGARLILHRDCA
ncbi:hypothetical protein OH818_01530 [Jiella pelagia]|uniref:Uncharacterized protein n=1 Tax=Jiella pelagia TaxID=2986949 RepID=A0ABY7BYY8_9HYPH|nr:hypothetical protein [Jiella pelagia]WAP69044.1 hypothetical protein OH818_01530 [Jiella pelagia]